MDQTSHSSLRALSAALAHASNMLRMPAEEISLESMVARDWPDSCLGLGQANEGCADVVTPGYLIVLGDGFRYRADKAGNIRQQTLNMDEELRIEFHQSGGIGGWSSEYVADDSTLSPEEADHVRRFIDESNFFEMPTEVTNGTPIADLYDYTVTLAHGRRNHTVHTYDGSGPHESPALVEFIGWLQERAPIPGPKIDLPE